MLTNTKNLEQTCGSMGIAVDEHSLYFINIFHTPEKKVWQNKLLFKLQVIFWYDFINFSHILAMTTEMLKMINSFVQIFYQNITVGIV